MERGFERQLVYYFGFAQERPFLRYLLVIYLKMTKKKKIAAIFKL
jgi:hypothetical protein